MLPPAVTRVLDRASRGEPLARAAAGESLALGPAGELDACHDGKPVCVVRPQAFLDGFPVFSEAPAAPEVVRARRRSLARALNRPVIFLGDASWSVVAP